MTMIVLSGQSFSDVLKPIDSQFDERSWVTVTTQQTPALAARFANQLNDFTLATALFVRRINHVELLVSSAKAPACSRRRGALLLCVIIWHNGFGRQAVSRIDSSEFGEGVMT